MSQPAPTCEASSGVFAFCSCFLVSFSCTLYPDPLICPPANFCTVTNYRLRLKLYRDTAPAASTEILYRKLILVARMFVPRLRQQVIKLYHDGKNCAPVSAYASSGHSMLPLDTEALEKVSLSSAL